MVFKNFLSKAKDIDILASLPDGVIFADNQGKIEWINDIIPAFFNMPKGEIFKLNLNELIESGLDLAKQAAETSKSVVGKALNTGLRDFYTEITAKNVEDCFVISLRDVTQSYKTVTSILVEHESSKKINKDKNAFLVKLSNELKSPIHSIVGFSQAMVDGLGGEMSDKQEKYIKIINKNSNELLYLIAKILELSKTESNLYEYDFQTFDIVNAVQAVLKNYEILIKDKNLNVTLDMEEIIKKTVFSDENAFKTIFENIIETSLNLTDIGSVNIKASYPELDFVSQRGIEITEDATPTSYLMITVSDTGAGIAENDLNVIFEPYAQLDRPNKKNIVRSISLAISKNLVKYLKGAIWMESEPMKGSTYNIIIPIEKG
ncbi:MAG: PAS domain-containing sensor histidine kinase [Candidatus Gastranaerophilales bacterium]|nr:PAS domain-containing sensor histidine kinase [Candidatus Gastranaerophilales bacterium]